MPGGSVSVTATQSAPAPGVTWNVTTGAVGELVSTVRVTCALAGAAGAPGIPVSLDGGRTAVSGADGRYIFDGVPEGAHEVSLLLAELPADFDPGGAPQVRVLVQPRRTARADFEVLPLMAIAVDAI